MTRHAFPWRRQLDEAVMNENLRVGEGSLIPKPNLARELGVSGRTISRWLDDPAIGFPRPIVVRSRNYFCRPDIEAWKSAQIRSAGADKLKPIPA
jgi:hypothetical protein